MARRSDSGQVGVETAIVMPMTIFLILGILQMSMMQQARLLTEYAAFRAVRAGSVDQANCKKMVNAAIEALLPSFGRTDTAQNLVQTYTVGDPTRMLNPMSNQSGVSGLKIVDISYLLQQTDGAPVAPYKAQDFDDPNHPLNLVAQVTYNYELRIPFADFMIHEMWTGSNYVGGTVDQLVPATNSSKNTNDTMMQSERTTKYTSDTGANKAQMLAAAKTQHRYIIPIVSSYTMRMMSNLSSGVTASASQQTCP
jgi:hypothetical protein